MKTFLCAGAIIAVSPLTIAGCASQSPNTAASAANPAQTTYTQEDLKKTGRQQTGDALQALDPSVQATDGR
jgi:hypothetical protein